MININRLKRKDNGITLIALVVTIIVILILASISISILTGGNGIINRAGEAKNRTEEDNEKELIELAALQTIKEDKQGNLDKDKLVSKIKEATGKENLEIDNIGKDLFVKLDGQDKYYKINKNGNVEVIMEVDKATDANPGDITTDADGNILAGTATDPYQISSIEDLCGFSNAVNNGEKYIGKYIKLMNNLNFESGFSYISGQISVNGDIVSCSSKKELMDNLTDKNKNGFIPIGKESSKYFQGNFDGNNKKIENIYIKSENHAGLIGIYRGSEIKDLTISGKINIIGNYAGSIAAECVGSKINNCISYVEIKAKGNNIGGIIGSASGTAAETINCKNYGKITIESGECIGGIAGSGMNAKNCENNCEISGSGNFVSGIVGQWGSATNCNNYSNITGKARVGGISGHYGAVSDCKNYGEINGTEYCGGIIGFNTNNKNVSRCINYGKVTGVERVGGILGNLVVLSVENCVNKGEVYASNYSAGGIVGMGSSFNNIINCYNDANVSSPERVGGICAEVRLTNAEKSLITNCYSTGILTSNKELGGVIGGKTSWGTHYMENSYWPSDFNINSIGKNGTSDVVIIDNQTVKSFTLNDMKSSSNATGESKSFLAILNDFVNNYNTTASEDSKLLNWKYDDETGYPTLDFEHQ